MLIDMWDYVERNQESLGLMKTCVFVIISIANGSTFVSFCIQFQSTNESLSVAPNREERDAVILVKNSRFVMRTGRKDVEHALESDSKSRIV
jgi:hypothetical protein